VIGPDAKPADLSAAAATAKADRRVLICWGAGLAALAVLGFFCWAFLFPVVQARSALDRAVITLLPAWVDDEPGGPTMVQACFFNTEFEFQRSEIDCMIQRLGGPARAVRALRLYLRLPKRWADRPDAAIALLPHCGKPGLAALLDLAKSADTETRWSAAWALGQAQIPAPEIVLPLAHLLEDPDARVRLCAAKGFLVLAGAEAPMGGIGCRPADHRWVIDAIVAGMQDTGHLDAHSRYLCATALGRAGTQDDRVIGALARGLSDQDVPVRRSSAWAMDHLGVFIGWDMTGCDVRPAVDAAARALKDEDEEVRSFAAWSLSRMGEKALPAVPALLEAAGDSSSGVRHGAAYALGRIGPKAVEAVPTLEKMLSDDDETVPTFAAEALGRIKSAEKPK
jgi:HEAT repeat protein